MSDMPEQPPTEQAMADALELHSRCDCGAHLYGDCQSIRAVAEVLSDLRAKLAEAEAAALRWEKRADAHAVEVDRVEKAAAARLAECERERDEALEELAESCRGEKGRADVQKLVEAARAIDDWVEHGRDCKYVGSQFDCKCGLSPVWQLFTEALSRFPEVGAPSEVKE